MLLASLPLLKPLYDQTYESEHIADHLRWQIGEGSRRHGWVWEQADAVAIVVSLLLSRRENVCRSDRSESKSESERAWLVQCLPSAKTCRYGKCHLPRYTTCASSGSNNRTEESS
jgi:phage FluMu gp28-like protein